MTKRDNLPQVRLWNVVHARELALGSMGPGPLLEVCAIPWTLVRSGVPLHQCGPGGKGAILDTALQTLP